MAHTQEIRGNFNENLLADFSLEDIHNFDQILRLQFKFYKTCILALNVVLVAKNFHCSSTYRMWVLFGGGGWKVGL
jgi:hypothetical protein